MHGETVAHHPSIICHAPILRRPALGRDKGGRAAAKHALRASYLVCPAASPRDAHARAEYSGLPTGIAQAIIVITQQEDSGRFQARAGPEAIELTLCLPSPTVWVCPNVV